MADYHALLCTTRTPTQFRDVGALTTCIYLFVSLSLYPYLYLHLFRYLHLYLSEVEEQHARFCLAMRQLFDAHKKDYVAMGADSSWLEKTLRLENE